MKEETFRNCYSPILRLYYVVKPTEDKITCASAGPATIQMVMDYNYNFLN